MADEPDNLETSYLQAMRRSGAGQAGDRLLAELGLDPQGNPLQQGQAPVQPQTSLQQRQASQPQRQQRIEQAFRREAQQNPPPSFMGDVVGGTLKEIPRAVYGGARQAVEQLNKTAADLAGFVESKTGIPKGGSLADAIVNALPKMEEPKTAAGGLIQGVSQFITGYVSGSKALGALGVAKGAMPYAAGAFSDIAAFSPDDPTLSNLINNLAPALQNPVTEFLATDPQDSEALNRLKRAVEGFGLGKTTDIFMNLLTMARASRAGRRAQQAFETAQAQPRIEEPAPTAPAAQAIEPEGIPAAAPSPASQIDIVRPSAAQDIPVGTTGRAGVMQGERLALPAPGQATQTVDEIAENLAREQRARATLEGNPTLRAAQETMAIKEELRGNPTLRAAYETTLKGESEEAMVRELVKDRPTFESIIQSQKGEISSEAVHTMARAAVGATIGLTQGETMEDRIANALLIGGAAAVIKPAWIKKIVGALEKANPQAIKVIKSFDPPTTAVSKKGIPSRRVAAKPVEIASEAQAKEFLAADPSTIQVGKKALKINWEEIGSQQEMDDVIKTVTKLNEESIDVARRGVISDEKTRQLANMLGMTEDDLLRRRRGQAMNAEQTQAMIDIYGSAVKSTDDLAKRLKAGENVEAQFRIQLGRTTALTHEIFGARAEAGRALRMWATAAQQLQVAGQMDLLTISGKSADQIPAERLADMFLALENPAQKATFVSQAFRIGKSAILEAWINGLLSNPVTHAANTISNTAVLGMGIIERGIAGVLGKEIARGEAGAMLHGLSGGWIDALKLARKAFVAGESQLGFSKIDIPQRAITAENLGASGGLGRAVDLIGNLVTTPGRALMAADDFFKAINYRMELHAQAFRQASKEGLAPEKMGKRVDELVRDTDFASVIKDQLEGFAAYQTFTQPLGQFGSNFIHFLDEHPIFRVVVPFVRTPVNIAKYTLERTPLVNLAMKQVREDLATGGVKRDMALAKTALGGMMFLTAGALASAGYITGGGPMDPDLKNLKRAKGWQAYSFKIGDRYVSFARTDPVGFFFGMAADMVEKGGELDDVNAGSLAAAAVLALKDTFINKTYMTGILDAFEALTSPTRRWENYFERLAGSLVPAGVANLARNLDPTIKEVNGAADAIFARLPGYSSTVPARRNIWGEKIELEGALGPDMISPFYTSTEIEDPVTDEMLRLEISVGMPPKHVFGTRPTDSPFAAPDPRRGVELLPEEYDRYVELAGKELKIGGLGLHDKLKQMINSESYKGKSDLLKQSLIQRTFSIYREAAQQKLLQEFPELQDAVREKIQERREALRAPAFW